MTAFIVIPVNYNMRQIAELAGVTDPSAMWYDSGTFYVNGIDQITLDTALGQYSVADEQKNNLKKTIADVRWQYETGGIYFNGIPIATDRESQGLITGATLQAVIDPNYTVSWKTPVGWVENNATQLIALATAVRAHVQNCFNRESVLWEAIEDDTYVPTMLAEGWPSNDPPV